VCDRRVYTGALEDVFGFVCDGSFRGVGGGVFVCIMYNGWLIYCVYCV